MCCLAHFSPNSTYRTEGIINGIPLLSPMQGLQVLLIALWVSFLVSTLLVVLICRPAAMDKSNVPPALMRRTVPPLKAAWTLTGLVETACVSPKSCAAMERTTAWITLMKRTVVRKMCSSGSSYESD